MPVTTRTPMDLRVACVLVGRAYENFYRQDERLQSQNHGVNDADRVDDVKIIPLEEADIFVRQPPAGRMSGLTISPARTNCSTLPATPARTTILAKSTSA